MNTFNIILGPNATPKDVETYLFNKFGITKKVVLGCYNSSYADFR
ncbi:hypothetical protein [Candidatus Phytoplasma ziziphi]|nr:hypothetical protein [Candidatus Phytoplasma ziziphi]